MFLFRILWEKNNEFYMKNKAISIIWNRTFLQGIKELKAYRIIFNLYNNECKLLKINCKK